MKQLWTKISACSFVVIYLLMTMGVGLHKCDCCGSEEIVSSLQILAHSDAGHDCPEHHHGGFACPCGKCDDSGLPHSGADDPNAGHSCCSTEFFVVEESFCPRTDTQTDLSLVPVPCVAEILSPLYGGFSAPLSCQMTKMADPPLFREPGVFLAAISLWRI